MKVFVAVDMEGIAGLVQWDGAQRELERRLMTEEVNAAARGAFAGGAIVFFMIIYLWAQFVATGKALSSMTDNLISYKNSVLIGAVIIIGYTTMGGFIAVVWTDVLQAALMCLALIGLPIYCLYMVINQGQLTALLEMPSLGNSAVQMGDICGGFAGLALFTMLISRFGIGAGYVGQPHITSRYMALRDAKDTKICRRIALAWVTCTSFGVIIVGVCARVLLSEAPDDPEKVLLIISKVYLPGWLAGIIIAAVMSAIMSSADSFLIAAVSSLQEDFTGWLRGTSKSAIMSRIITIIFGLIGAVLALTSDPGDPNLTVFKLAVYAWGGLGITLGVSMVYCLSVKKPKTVVVLSTMLSGLIMMLIWNKTGLSEKMYEVIPCLLFQSLVCYLFHKYMPELQNESDREEMNNS